MMKKHNDDTKQSNGLKSVSICLILFSLLAAAGCSGLNGTPNSTSTPTVSPESPTETTRHTATPTLTPTTTPERTASREYEQFYDSYLTALENKSVNVSNKSLDSKNSTIYIEYSMKDPEDDNWTGWERENVSLLYAVGVETYLNESLIPTVNESSIPKQVNVTALAPDGERYETAYTTLERAKKMVEGDISPWRYVVEYYGTIEPGPAHPDYGG